MSKYSCLNILKHRARQESKKQSISHVLALSRIATSAGFNSLHEMQKIAKSEPMETRLKIAALGYKDLHECIYETAVLADLDSIAEDELSGLIAETNAEMFQIEDIETSETKYDPLTGKLTLNLSFCYNGDQHPNRAYHGHSIFVEGELNLIRRNDQWSLDTETGLVIEIAYLRE